MILDDIISGVVGELETIVINDTQTTFTELDSGTLEETALDYAFVIDDVRVQDRDGTGSTGYVFRYVSFVVKVKAVNEGRSFSNHVSYAAQCATAIQDNVTNAVNLISGVGACFTSGPAAIDRDPQEPTVFYVSVPFTVEYTDTIITT